MAKDDGSKVAIKSETVQFWFPDIGYVHYVKICNKTNAVKKVYVTSWPYSAPGKKIGQRKIEEITLPANACKTTSFTFPKKPTGYYTDIYEHEGVWPNGSPNLGDRLHYGVGSPPAKIKSVKCLAYHRPARVIFACTVPYPRSLESSEGPLAFYVRKVNGLPKDWKIVSCYPEIGTLFTLTPDQKEEIFTMEISIQNRITEQINIDLSVDVAIKNRKLTPPYAYSVDLPLVNKFEAPIVNSIKSYYHPDFSSIIFEIEATDEMSLLDSPIISYSKDSGKSWQFIGTEMMKILSWGKYGVKHATFRSEILIPNKKSKILASVILRDTVDNEAPVPIQQYPETLDRKTIRRPSRKTNVNKKIIYS